MISLQIEIDEATDRELAEMAEPYGGDRGKAVMDLVREQLIARSNDFTEEDIDEAERIHHDSLVMQLERSERGFREGRFTTWEEVKRRNGL